MNLAAFLLCGNVYKTSHMGIKGKIPASFSDDCVRDMIVGDSAYIYHRDFVLTKKALFLDWIAPIVHEEELDDDEKDDYIFIRRVGSGLTQDDFEIDFTPHVNGILQLEIEPEAVYLSCIKNSKGFIVFPSPELQLAPRKNLSKEDSDTESLENLQLQLKEATK